MTAQADHDPSTSLTLSPIGVVHSPHREPATAARQSSVARKVRGSIELFAGHGFEFALSDLKEGQHLWIIFWFHRSRSWRPRVRPPRSAERRGVFSTRAPHRPNPIGLSVVRLLEVRGLSLDIAGVDMLDGTPVLDIKPYLPYADAILDADSGWLTTPEDPGPTYQVCFEMRAREQLEFLRSGFDLDLEAGLTDALALGPHPHPYRRIKAVGGLLQLAHKEWRARFETAGQRILVRSLATGYRARQLASDPEPKLEIHRAFVAQFGYPGHGSRFSGEG